MTAIWHREWKAYFHTPVGYVFMGVFLLLSGILFDAQILQTRSGDLLTLIGQMSYLWMLLCPVLTMRLMSEEKKTKTDQLLLTAPVSRVAIILGKYLSALCVFVISIAGTLVNTFAPLLLSHVVEVRIVEVADKVLTYHALAVGKEPFLPFAATSGNVF